MTKFLNLTTRPTVTALQLRTKQLIVIKEILDEFGANSKIN